MNSNQRLSKPLFRAMKKTERMGVEIPKDLAARLHRIVGRVSLLQIDSSQSPDLTVRAWVNSESVVEMDERVWVVFLACLRSEFASSTPALADAMKRAGLYGFRTRVEVDLKFGAHCYHLGRQRLGDPISFASGVLLLREAVSALSKAVFRDDQADPSNRQKTHGQIATSALQIARHCPETERKYFLDVALTHSDLAEKDGDLSNDHYGYKAEIAVRQFTSTKNVAFLDAASESLAQVSGEPSRRVVGTSADITSERAELELAGGKAAAAVQYLGQAKAEYTSALSLTEEDSTDTGYLLARRGRTQLLLFRASVDEFGRRDSELLNDALDDLLAVKAENYRHDGIVAEALLDRARIRRRRNDHSGAKADFDFAVSLRPESPTRSVTEKMRTDQFEEATGKAISAGDPQEIGSLAVAMTAVPAGERLATAALALALDHLRHRVAPADWIPIALRALDRMDVEADHPALTDASLRHVAGHAADLAYRISCLTADPEHYRRAVVLHRISISAGPDASVSQLTHAGYCAIDLATALFEGYQEASEESMGLWEDGAAWLTSAILLGDTRANGRVSVDTHRPRARLATVALQLHRLTGQQDWFDIAADAANFTSDSIDVVEEGHRTAGYDTSEGTGRSDSDGVTEPDPRSLAGLSLQIANLAGVLRPGGPDPTGISARAWAESEGTEELDVDGVGAGVGRTLELLRAAQLAVEEVQFPAWNIGGQQRSGYRGVRTIRDPHRLLEQTLVLKRTRLDQAQREMDMTQGFENWLRASPTASATWLTPQPLGVVDNGDGDGTYVMRRQAGRPLAWHLFQWKVGKRSDPTGRFLEAAGFLAEFHAWRAQNTETSYAVRVATVHDLHAQAARAVAQLALPPEIASHLQGMLEYPLDSGTMLLAKKDAHAGNWILTPKGELVLIDIESPKSLPVMLELVTVLDDLPLMEVSQHGWESRLKVARDYLDLLGKHRMPTDATTADLRSQYDVMALFLATIGLSRLARKEQGVSSASLRAFDMQQRHYQELAGYLAKYSDVGNVRIVAKAVVERRNASRVSI